MRIRISRRHRPMEFDRFSSYCYRVFFSFSSFEILFFSFSSLLFFFSPFLRRLFISLRYGRRPGLPPKKSEKKKRFTILPVASFMIQLELIEPRAGLRRSVIHRRLIMQMRSPVCVCVCVSGSFAYDGNRSVLCFVLFCFFVFFSFPFFCDFSRFRRCRIVELIHRFKRKKRNRVVFFPFPFLFPFRLERAKKKEKTAAGASRLPLKHLLSSSSLLSA